MSSRLYRAAGLMSGTSMDGIDAALIETDGEERIRPLKFVSKAYGSEMRSRLRKAIGLAAGMETPAANAQIEALSRDLTMLHAEAIGALGTDIEIIGLHGHTLAHRPQRRWTWQIGDGALLASLTRTEVVDDFRSADVEAGGEGAPLLPAYHRALLKDRDRPAAILNLGGVGNMTWVGKQDRLLAFDTGPGNALLDDWVRSETGRDFDEDGALAQRGTVHGEVLDTMLANAWFERPPPKSLDRQDFGLGAVRGLSVEDGAATLTAFTAESVRLGLEHLPSVPERLLVSGGGRHNPVLMTMIAERTGLPADPVEVAGWRGDAMEAEGFAWFAVRRLRKLPVSFPETTGVPAPMIGGRLHLPA